MPNSFNEVLGALGSEHADDLVLEDMDKFTDALLLAGYTTVFIVSFDPDDGGTDSNLVDAVNARGWDSAESNMHKVKIRGNEGYDVYLSGTFDATYGSPDDSFAAWILVASPIA